MERPRDRADVVVKRDDCTFLPWRNYLCVFWHGPMTAATVRALDKELERVTSHGTRSVALLSVVDDHDLAPGAAFATGMAQVLEKYATCVRRSALVCEATGFRASVVRSVSTSVALQSRSHFPRRTFNSVAAAVHWVSEGQEDPGEGAALLAAVESARARLRHEASVRTQPGG